MKKKNTSLRIFDFDTFDFSKLGRELTEDELYIVNGGKQIENSDEAVANAQEGDTLTRNDNTTVPITRGDLVAAQKKLDQNTNSNSVSGNTETTSGNPSETSNTETEQNNNAVTITDRGYPSSISSGGSSQHSSSGTNSGSSTQSSSSSSNSNSNGSSSNNPKIYYLDNTSAKVDEINEIVSFEKDDIEGAVWAARAFSIKSNYGFTLNVLNKGQVVESFVSEKAAFEYINKLDPSKGNLSEASGKISTGTGAASELLDKFIENSDDLQKISKISKYSKTLNTVSNITGVFTVISDSIEFGRNPNLDTFTDLAIDSLGLFSGYAMWSIGLDVAKTGAEIIGEEIEKGVQYYKDYKINEMYSTFLPENERFQNMYESDNMFMKMTEAGVKQLFMRD